MCSSDLRFGKRNQPHFRIVVNEAKDKRDGSYVALLGHYAPAQEPKILEIDVKAFKEWLAKGAQPTDTVADLFKRYQSKDPFPPKKKKPSRKQLAKEKAAKEEKEAPKEEAPAAETPQEEATQEEATTAPAEEAAPQEETAEEKPQQEAPAE